MSTAIKATNSRGLKIINCRFQGFETDIELENVEDFVSSGNTFSRDDPQDLLKVLTDSIRKSNLSEDKKQELFQEIIRFLSESARDSNRKSILVNKIGSYIGDKAVDYFIQLASAVTSGLILNIK